MFPVGPKDLGKRLDRFLNERVPGLSRSRIQDAIRTRVTLSWDVRARPATPVRPGGEVRIGWVPLAEEALSIEFPILARHDGWLAVDKPPGIPVHPVNRVRENSLATDGQTNSAPLTTAAMTSQMFFCTNSTIAPSS